MGIESQDDFRNWLKNNETILNYTLAEKYAELFGLAFQMADDLLDFNGNYDECELNSYVKIHGAERTRSDIYSCISKAGTVLFKFNEKGFDTGALAALLDFLITRVEGV